MIYVYVRVSSKEQQHASQLPDLQRWVEASGQPAQWFDDKYTGKVMDRTGWNKLAAKLSPGDTVVIWRVDRLGRTTASLATLFESFVLRRINLVSVRDGIDLQTPAGRLIANVLASVAQFEVEVRKERTMAGIAAAHAKGKRWGGSKCGRKMKSRATVEQVRTIKLLITARQPIAQIARAVGLARPTVYRYLAAV